MAPQPCCGPARPRLDDADRSSAPWPRGDHPYAVKHGILGTAHLWEELHEALEPLTSTGSVEPLKARLISEFLAMLSEENLVPIKPLTTEETGPAWAEAWALLRRYREFFHACKAAVEERTVALPVPGSLSDRGDWFWQDYQYADGARMVLGLLYTDENERLPPGAHRRTPVVWFGIEAKNLPDWKVRAAWMDGNPPPWMMAILIGPGRRQLVALHPDCHESRLLRGAEGSARGCRHGGTALAKECP